MANRNQIEKSDEKSLVNKFLLLIIDTLNFHWSRFSMIMIFIQTSCGFKISFNTRMHSSRMRTGRSLTLCEGGVLPARGVLPAGDPPPGQNHRHE